ncbi:PP2C family protein-serine/threonine phosphatase [Segeticoccus rhizosphaerae]|jgi:protein phosphatase|uniref:PP2C family protein-serine/threonine phosphatase n=1 Tax=Segeticoccus rhizosphaerae TaxID=1104777 RepID=UPI0010C101A2|nr:MULTISPECIES: PP2C family serine/threonine-protein phosphatase [Intrasporangiaceae]
MPIALRYAARSDLGLGSKSRNEDSGYAGPDLLILADGMGGHAAGDVASSLVVGELVHLDGENHGADDVLEQLGKAVRRANRRLRDAMEDSPELDGMGTTLIAMLRSGNKLALANIGDSRAYLLRDGVFTQITRDHSFVQSLLDEGRITPDEALHHPQRSLVTRVMTGRADDDPDLSLREARPGDRYLLCSDGLSDFVSSEIIEEIFGGDGTPGEIADRLIQVALRASARDNVTCVVAEVVPSSQSGTPTTAEVVGAAAERRATTVVPTKEPTPAEKARALSRQANAPDVEEEDDFPPTLAEEGPHSGLARWVRWIAALVLAVVVIGGGAFAAYGWSQQQYYVGEHDGRVTIYRGVSQDLGPVSLSSVDTETDVFVADLPDYYRDQVADTLSAASHDDAVKIVAQLRGESEPCRVFAATGGSCHP